MALKTTQQLIDDANNNQPDNTDGLIEPVDTREQDINTAESSVNKLSDANLLGLKDYDLSRSYEAGEGCFESGKIYRSNKPTSGVFVPADWDEVGTAATSLILGAMVNGLILTGTGQQTLQLQEASGSQAGALSSSKYSEFEGKQDALGYAPEDPANKGAADGYAPLNSSAKLDAVYLPDALLGAVVYQGVWNAATNTPTLSDATGTKGHYYIVNVAGQQDLGSGTISFNINDWLVHNGSSYDVIAASSAPSWGSIQGSISNQQDLVAELAKKLEDAPSDGQQYARKNGGWAIVVGGGGGGSYAFTNGLNETSGVAKLGGNLIENTVIQGDSNNYSLTIADLAGFAIDTLQDTLSLTGGFTYSYDNGAGDVNTTTLNPGGFSSSSSNGVNVANINVNPGGLVVQTDNGVGNARAEVNESGISLGGSNAVWLHSNQFGLAISNSSSKPVISHALQVFGTVQIITVDSGSDNPTEFLYQDPSGVIKKQGVNIASKTVAGGLYFDDDQVSGTLTISTTPIT